MRAEYILLYFLFFIKQNATIPKCDRSLGSKVLQEGLLGEVNTFPWLGTLKVYIRELGAVRVALTGIVLVKSGYAIANAHEIAKIPKRIFKMDSQAMFIPSHKEPWFCLPLDYLLHPEYRERHKFNTIALIHLDMGPKRLFPIPAVCWPPYSYNTSQELYAVGYTDESGPLGKFIHKMVYLNTQLCDTFYNKADLADDVMVPVSYHCAFAKNLHQNCVWETGMALVSNATGYWVLIGFGTRGPGCLAPARFVDMMPYWRWIQNVTTRSNDTMRSAFGVGSRRAEKETDLFPDWYFYGYDTVAEPFVDFTLHRPSAYQVIIIPAPGIYRPGACDPKRERLLYREEAAINTVIGEGPSYHMRYRNRRIPVKIATYWLSLYDLKFYNYSCASLKLHCSGGLPQPVLYTTASIDNMGDTAFGPYKPTPEEIVKITPIRNRTADDIVKESGWMPHGNLRPTFIKDDRPRFDFDSVNLHFTFKFTDRANFTLNIYGYPKYSKLKRHRRAKARLVHPRRSI